MSTAVTITDIELPEPGIHQNVAFETYKAWPAINSGAVKWGMVSPKHMRAGLDGLLDSGDTKDRKLGRAIHVMLLEPDRFHEQICVADPCSAVLKSGDRKGEACGNDSKFYDGENWFCGTHSKGKDGQEPTDYVSRDEFRRIERIAESIHEHQVMELFRRPGWSEVSLLWEESGLKFKGRLDRYSGGDGAVIIDIKKCQVGAGDREDCEKSICNYGWYRQAAIYMRGIEVLTGTRPDFVWVFIEDNHPFDVNVIPIDEETYEIGKWEVDQVISSYRLAMKNDNFHGYIYDPQLIKRGGLGMWDLAKKKEKKEKGENDSDNEKSHGYDQGGLPNWKRNEFKEIL